MAQYDSCCICALCMLSSTARTLQRSAPQPLSTNIQQNQRSTPYAVTHGLCSPEDGHNDA